MTPSSALDALARRALRRWGVEHCAPQLLKHRENAVFRVSMRDGSPAVLRIHRAGYHNDAALRSELEWMAFLRTNDIPTPSPIRTLDGELLVAVDMDDGGPRQVDCLTWVDGRLLGASGVPLGLPEDEASRIFSGIGGVMARIHHASSQWRPPTGFTRHAWDFEAFFGPTPLWGPFKSSPWLDADQSRIVSAAAARAAARLAPYERSARNFGLIHADLVRENVLIDGRSLRTIDFDDSGFGWHMYDIAVALYQNRREPNYRVIEAALLEGYRSHRPLSDADVAALPIFTALRAFALLGWWTTRAAGDSSLSTARRASSIAVEAVRDFLGSPD